MILKLLVLCLLSSLNLHAIGNERINNFSQAKTYARQVFGNTNRDLYCDCTYNGSEIDYGDCNFQPQKDLVRANRVEWEHVVPASQFGRTFREWSVGDPSCVKAGKKFRGRKCAERTSREFSRMESDLYNLYPSVGEANGIRENFPIGEIEGERRDFGDCDFEVVNGVVEPREAVRGEIARAYLYMDSTYPNRDILNPTLKALAQKWDDADPVDREECERYLEILKLQGNDNPVLHDRCERAGLL